MIHFEAVCFGSRLFIELPTRQMKWKNFQKQGYREMGVHGCSRYWPDLINDKMSTKAVCGGYPVTKEVNYIQISTEQQNEWGI